MSAEGYSSDSKYDREMRAHIKTLVDEAPPLSRAQLDQLSVLLRTDSTLRDDLTELGNLYRGDDQ